MATKALANDIQLPAMSAIQEVHATVADAAHLLDTSKLAEPCRACAVCGYCHAARLMTMASGRTASPHMHSHALSQGEHVFNEGSELKAVYVVKTGSVKSNLTSTAGDEQVVDFHLPGELLGLDSFGIRVHRSSAVTLEGTIVCSLPVAHLEDVVRHVPGAFQWLLGLVGEELVQCHRTLLMLNRTKAETRLSHFLLDLSYRFHDRGYSAREFHLSMSRQDIGNHLGLAMETVSRLASRFQEDGLLEVNQRRQITILDAAGLAAR